MQYNSGIFESLESFQKSKSEPVKLIPTTISFPQEEAPVDLPLVEDRSESLYATLDRQEEVQTPTPVDLQIEGLFKDETENRKEVSSENLPSESEYSFSQGSNQSGRRGDVSYKACIRLIKRFYRDLFKDHNKKIVRRRYVN